METNRDKKSRNKAMQETTDVSTPLPVPPVRALRGFLGAWARFDAAGCGCCGEFGALSREGQVAKQCQDRPLQQSATASFPRLMYR